MPNEGGSKHSRKTTKNQRKTMAKLPQPPKPKKVRIGQIVQGRGMPAETTSTSHGYLAESNLSIYTPDVDGINIVGDKGIDFFHYNINQPITINTITNKELGDRGTITLNYTSAGHDITWDPEYWFPSGPLALETGTDAWNIIDYKVIAVDKICMEFVASCPGTIIFFQADFETNAAAEIDFTDVSLTGTGFEYSDDAGVTWNTYSGATPWVTPGAGLYTMKKEDGPLNVKFGDGSTVEGAKFINNMTVSGYGATSMEYMFNASDATNIDITGMNTSDVTSMWSTFSSCNLITTIDCSNLDTSKVTSMWNTFINCTLLSTVTSTTNIDTSNVINFQGCFQNCDALTGIGSAIIETDSATNLSNLFNNCSNLLTADVTNWNTTTVTDITGLFLNCAALTTLDISTWDTSNITEMDGVFNGTTSLGPIDITGWNTSSVETTNSMFLNSTAIADLSNFRLPVCTNMVQMMRGSSMTTIDTSLWGVTSVTNLLAAFNDTLVTSLDFTGWDFSNVTSYQDMFRNSDDLVCITNISTNQAGWPTKNNMFADCASLVQPDAAAITDLTDSDGADWINPGVCP